MRNKKKLVVAILALVLVAVAAAASVVAVFAVNVAPSEKVFISNYTATKDVVAIVSAEYTEGVFDGKINTIFADAGYTSFGWYGDNNIFTGQDANLEREANLDYVLVQIVKNSLC